MPRANSTYDIPVPRTTSNWLYTLEPYLNNASNSSSSANPTGNIDPVLMCPRCNLPLGTTFAGGSTYYYNTCNYGMNWLIDIQQNYAQLYSGFTTPTNFKLAQLHPASSIVVFGDKNDESQSPWINLDTSIGPGNFGTGTAGPYPPQLRHGGGWSGHVANPLPKNATANVVYADGHVDSLNTTQYNQTSYFKFNFGQYAQ